MPRALISPIHSTRDESPERGVRTAESCSRSPSPSTSPRLLIKYHRRSRTSARPCSALEQAAFHFPRSTDEDCYSPSYLRSADEDDGPVISYLRGCHLDDCRLDCPEELYNLTKLAEVSLAAASGQLFSKRYFPIHNYEVWPEQEFPEDLSRDAGDREHPCPECGKRYSTSSNLARHRQTHRSLADKKARRCPHCDKVYVSMPAFAMHVRTHNQGCRCSFCGKCFSRPWLLQGHIRTHTGEKPFKCTICNKAFADKSNLRAHIQTHSTMKPHVCSRCGKAFALKSYLYKHEESSCMKVPFEDIK